MIKKNIALYFIFFILTSSFAEEKDKFVDSDLEADLTYIFTEMATQASSIDGTYFYTSRNKRDAIIQKATIETIDKELKILDDAGRKTIQYLAYAWCNYAALKGNEQDKNARIATYLKAQDQKIKNVYEDIKNKGLNVDNINLQVTMYVYIINTVSVTVSGSNNVIAVSSHTGGAYIDRTFTKADLNTTCRNQIRDAISAEAKKQSSRNMLASPNQSLIWRAKLLKEKLLDCPTVPSLTGDQSKDLVEMLKYVKSKVANKQHVLLHPAPETPAELIAENVKLANTTYTKLRFRNNSTVNPSFSDPLNYTAEVYDKSAAFIFYDKDKPTNQLFTIALFDENNKEKKDSLEKWLFGGRVRISKVPTKEIVSFLSNEEAKVNHVYNDYKGANSYYCTEHKIHGDFDGNKCEKTSHWGEFTINGSIIDGYGNPTIGVGHLIIGSLDLNKWCDKEPITNNDISDLLFEDLKPRMKQLNKALPNNSNITQCQYDALLSIIFNRGIGCESCGKNGNGTGFKGSKLYKDFIKKGKFNDKDITDYIINDGSILAGSERRKDEANIFSNCYK